jgi:hypothetical protein
MVNSVNTEHNGLANIRVICPQCNKSKFIKIPASIITESTNVTTVSIPMNYVCEHSFQIFVDKRFLIRGYQRVDFDISNLEIYSETKEDLLITYDCSVVIKKIIQLIRENIHVKGLFGGLVLTDSGQLMFSSLPSEISFNMDLKKYFSKMINHVFLTFSNNQKIIATTLVVDKLTLIIALFISAEMDYNKANYYFLEFRKNILLHNPNDFTQNSYWLYSIISQNAAGSDDFFLDSLGIKIQKSVVENTNEIEEILKTKDYVGKVFVNERYVKLMGGLMWTVNDALLFISNLNI